MSEREELEEFARNLGRHGASVVWALVLLQIEIFALFAFLIFRTS